MSANGSGAPINTVAKLHKRVCALEKMLGVANHSACREIRYTANFKAPKSLLNHVHDTRNALEKFEVSKKRLQNETAVRSAMAKQQGLVLMLSKYNGPKSNEIRELGKELNSKGYLNVRLTEQLDNVLRQAQKAKNRTKNM